MRGALRRHLAEDGGGDPVPWYRRISCLKSEEVQGSLCERSLARAALAWTNHVGDRDEPPSVSPSPCATKHARPRERSVAHLALPLLLSDCLPVCLSACCRRKP